MLLYSSPTLSEELAHGLKGPRLTFSVEGASERVLNPRAVSIIEGIWGAEWVEPELDGPPLLPEGSPVRQLLGWVYRALKQARWPIFQHGVYEPAGKGRFDGKYHLLTRISGGVIPFRLFQLLLENAWVDAADAWSEQAFIDALDLIVEQIGNAGLPGTNQRWVLLELLRNDQLLTEIGSDIFQIGSGVNARFIRGTSTDDVSQLLFEIQRDKIAMGDLFRLHGLPSTEQRRVHNRQQALDAAVELGYPIVLKPFNGKQSQRVFSEIQNRRTLDLAMTAYGSNLSDGLVEKFVPGISVKIFVMAGEILWILGRQHQFITGDGKRSIDELIHDYCSYEISEGFLQKERSDPDSFNNRFRIDQRFTQETLKSILPDGKQLRLTSLPSATVGTLYANFSPEHLSPQVVENVHYLSWLFGDAPLGIDAIGKFSDGQFPHLVFTKVRYGPQIEHSKLQRRFIEALIEQVSAKLDNHKTNLQFT